MRLVKEAVRKVDFADSSVFDSNEQSFFHDMRKKGLPYIVKILHDAERREFNKNSSEEARKKSNWVRCFIFKSMTRVGDCIFDHIPQDKLLSWIPFNDVRVVPHRRHFRVIFRSLCQESTSGGIAYFSKHQPTITINGESYVVAFSSHSITRACDRIVPAWKTYAGLGDAFAFFNSCMYFEQAKLEGEQLAFAFYDEALRGFATERYVKEVLGQEIDPKFRYYFRVGYCPAVVATGRNGTKFIKAMTQLPPGYRGTPEFYAIKRARLPWAEREKMLEKCKNLVFRTKDFDYNLMKWMHENGCPQVIKTDKQFYNNCQWENCALP